ncbi:hypothetical protein CRG98_007497 [Punica granatum]|uniref:G-patch domain-containing protein n=1 Tax=Punica granatum TaxID=22663 RepID=A0A2I0KUV0_PUNGR|nr:hypothetical protein CRG98_007497 [Punica granatum]
MGVKLGRIDGPSRKKDGETSKKQNAGTSRRANFDGLHPCTADFLSICTPRALYAALSNAAGHTPQLSPLLCSRHRRNSTLLLKLNKVDPRLRDLLSRLNVLQPQELNRAMLLNRVGASSTPLYQLFPSIYSGSFSQAIRSKQRRLILTSTPQCRIKTYVVNFIKETSALGITCSSRFYQGPESTDKGKASAASFSAVPKAAPLPTKKVTEQEAEAFMKLEPHRDALLKVLTGAQVPKETAPDRIEEIVNSIFSNQISFAEDELSSEVCMLKQMNVDMSHICVSKTTVRAFDGSRRKVNGEIDLLIDVDPCSFSVTFQILEIPNALSLLFGRPWIHAASAVLSSLHQKLKFFVEGKLINVNGEEDYAIDKETAVPYISIGEDHNLPFHSFDIVSVIRDYGEVGPSRADCMIRKVLLKNDYVPGTGLGACARGILLPIKMEEYRNRRGLGFRPSCHAIVQARRGKHLHRLAAHDEKLSRGIPVPPLSQFFPAPPQVMGGTSDSPSTELDDSSSDTAEALQSNPNHGCNDSNSSETRLGKSLPIYFGEGLDEDGRVLEIEEKEVVKKVDAGFLELYNYSEWVANIVPVKKKNGKVRVCIDYRDLNRASPKDNFPLPHIDVLVDNTARHTQFFFMDDFFGYNKIQMAKEDKIKTTFITMWGTFCYKVMPFGLKNAGATYQRAMVTLFHDMMHKEIEVYINDMIAKSKEVNKKVIEVDPDKIKAIMELPPPSTCANNPEIEKMCCALMWVMQRLRQYTIYHTIRLLSKTDPLKYLLDSPSSMRNLAKWRCQLMEYDIEYVSRTSVKGQAIADHLAEFPIDDDTPINSDFPDEEILQVSDEEENPGWKMYFDGAVNFTGSSIGAVLISPEGRHFLVAAKIHFPCTNNVAEYEACIFGLQAAIDLKVKELEVFGDSMLTIFQTLKQWKIKDPKLALYHEYLMELTENFENISFTYTPRMKNHITKENLIEPLEFEIAKGLAHYDMIEAVDGKPWYADIKHLLQTGQFLAFTDRHDRRTLRRITTHFFLSGETLYRHSFDTTLLRRVDENKAQRIMEEVHEGNCGPHMNGLMLAKKLMRLGYFWSTMETDCVKHVWHCHLCQVYANQIKALPNELHPLAALWPFSMWGMDVIDLAVARFLKCDIIARYGVLATLIADNAKNLNNKLINELCAQFRIQHHNSSLYRPQMNVNYKDWHEMHPFALLAYRTSIRSTTGATPCSLVYGMEAVLPVEVEIPSMRVLAESKLKEAEWVKQRYEQLNLIYKKRLTALCHDQCYQQRMTRTFNRKVRPREFSPDDLSCEKNAIHLATRRASALYLANPPSKRSCTPQSIGQCAHAYCKPLGSVPTFKFLFRGPSSQIHTNF